MVGFLYYVNINELIDNNCSFNDFLEAIKVEHPEDNYSKIKCGKFLKDEKKNNKEEFENLMIQLAEYIENNSK